MASFAPPTIQSLAAAAKSLRETHSVVTTRDGKRYAERADGTIVDDLTAPRAVTCARCGLIETVCACTCVAREDADQFYVAETTASGRGAFAKRAMPAGTVILREEGFIFVPLSTGPALPDATTRELYSRIPFAAMKHGVSAQLLEASVHLRWNMLHPPPAAVVREDESSARRASLADVEQLVGHSEADTGSLYAAFGDVVPDDDVLGTNATVALTRCAQIINANAHALSDGSKLEGFGLFPAVALLNHSCNPNCTYSAAPRQATGTMEVRLVRDVAEGEQLTVRYSDGYLPRSLRRARLRKARFFDCACERCEAHALETSINGATCPNSGCGGYVALESTRTCSVCGKRSTSEDLSPMRAFAEELGKLVRTAEAPCAWKDGGDASDVAAGFPRALERALEQAPRYLHPHHHLVMKGHRFLFAAAMKQLAGSNIRSHAPQRENAIRHGTRLADCLQSPVYPPFSVEAAAVLLQLGECYIGAARQAKLDGKGEVGLLLKRAIKVFKRALRHQEICCGSAHRLFQETFQRIHRVDVSIRAAMGDKHPGGREEIKEGGSIGVPLLTSPPP